MGILLIYDVTSTTSFDNIRNWVASLEQYADENINKILIGNKCDMADKRVRNLLVNMAHQTGCTHFQGARIG